MGLGSLLWSSVLNSPLPSQKLRPDTWPDLQNIVSHTTRVLEDPHFIWKENKSGNLISDIAQQLFFPLCFVCFTYSLRTLCRGLAPALQARFPRAMAELTLQFGVCTEPPQWTLISRWWRAMCRDTTYAPQYLTIFFNLLSQNTFYISQL